MKTFDYDQVTAVVSPLKAKLQDCAHGEGNQCETLDCQLDCCATICFEFIRALREWAHGVFSGEIVFDSAADNVWRTEATQIFGVASQFVRSARNAEIQCWDLPGQSKLTSAVWELHLLVSDWVTPKLAVNPGARVRLNLSDEERKTIQKQLLALPSLGAAGGKIHRSADATG